MNRRMPEVVPEPPSESTPPRNAGAKSDPNVWHRVRGLLFGFRKGRNGDSSPRDTLDELIEERQESETPLDEDERTLVANILHLRDRAAEDAMVPRADIVAVESKTSLPDVIALMTKTGHSRLPVYRETLDDAIGMIHIKDVISWEGDPEAFNLSKILRRVLFVAPSMEILELLLEMRAKRSHMALVVDEFGGIDGLITIEDVVEEIVGEIEDEHDSAPELNLIRRPDGTIDADARAPIEVIEEEFQCALSEEEKEYIDTLGGLVVSLSGRVPIRGELIAHPSGVEFEVLEADPRRIKRLRIRGPGAALSPVSTEAKASKAGGQ
jgi:CBS domain containing-hemolysin-like protein